MGRWECGGDVGVGEGRTGGGGEGVRGVYRKLKERHGFCL